MKKNVFTYALFALLLICVMVSCNNGSSPSPAEPDRPSKLEVSSFKNNYPVGATKDDLVGNLIYTDTKGKITTVDIKAEGVTTNFDATAAAENKVLTITYKGIDASATYNVVKIEDVDVSGCFVFDDDLTIDFYSGSKTAEITKFKSWDQFMNYTDFDPEKQVTEVDYKVALSPAGYTVIKLTYGDKNYTFYPDGNGGVRSYPIFIDLVQPDYISAKYVSPEKEKISALGNVEKYLTVIFTSEGEMKMWFSDTKGSTDGDPTVVISADNIKFGIGGVEIRKGTDGGEKAKNLRMYMKDGNEKIIITSSSGDDYVGYSFALELKHYS